MTSALEIQHIRRARPSGVVTIIEGVKLAQGERLCIVGPCDSGKSAIALGIVGRLHARGIDAAVLLDGRSVHDYKADEISRKCGFVPSDATLCFSGMRSTVRGELVTSLQFGGVSEFDGLNRIAVLGQLLKIDHLLDKPPFDLSGGEQVRVALAIVLAKGPSLLILDDIFCSLDPGARQEVHSILGKLSTEGCSVVETHSECPESLDDYAKLAFLTRPRAIVAPPAEALRALSAEHEIMKPVWLRTQRRLDSGSADQSMVKQRNRSEGALALEAKDITYSYPNSSFRLGPVSLLVRRGEVVSLVGANGAGKTTLLKTIAQLCAPQTGSVIVRDREGISHAPPRNRRLHEWAQQVMYAFQNPDDQIYSATVKGELLASFSGRPSPQIAERLAEVATQLELDGSLEDLPLDLPRSIRRLVTTGTCLVASPSIVLLDEPSSGLDQHQKARLVGAIAWFAERGGTVICVTHDIPFLLACSTHIIEVAKGGLGSLTSLESEECRPILEIAFPEIAPRWPNIKLALRALYKSDYER